MSRGLKKKPKGKNDEDLTVEEFDEKYGISPEVRKELNDPKGWVTGIGTPMIKKPKLKPKQKKMTKRVVAKIVDKATEKPYFTQYSNMGLG